ncbi:MAG: hypothetical protein U0Y68_01305 [Blastocatellia bacterium]
MKSNYVLLSLLVACSLSVCAQDTPPKKIAQLTMDDLENRTVAPPPPLSSVSVTPPPAAPTSTKKNATPSPAPASSAADGKTLLAAAWGKMTRLQSGRMQVITQAPGKEGKTYFYEFSGSDRVRMVMEGSEIITIAAVTYAKAPGQGWRKVSEQEMPKSAAFNPADFFAMLGKQFMEGPMQVQRVGEESLQGIPVLKFQVTDKNQDTGYLWLGKSDGLIYQIEELASSRSGYIKVIFSDLNGAISITPPAQ